VVLQLSDLLDRFPRSLVVAEVRAAQNAVRTAIRAGRVPESAAAVAQQARAALEALAAPSLQHVINATGVILHTNLGRAPLPQPAPVQGWYSNLEYDLASGRRGRRDEHTQTLWEKLLGVPAIMVNNGAAAVYLALHELAAGGGEVIVSRGEMIEIGDGFRIPDIMARSGARLVEVGTTNRTRLSDYADAITPQTRLLMRVHPSNFRVSGFTGRPDLAELAQLAHEHGLPLYEDLGSGCLVDLKPFGIAEPVVRESFRAGVDLVSFSGDKLLGGPQAGVLAGNADLLARLRRNPMFRALRLDKLVIQAMESTLRAHLLEQLDALPVLKMIRQTPQELRSRAERILCESGAAGEVIESDSLLGGGSTPEQTLPGYAIALSGDAIPMEQMLRSGTPPVIGRIQDNRLLLDPRTVAPADEPLLIAALRRLTEPV